MARVTVADVRDMSVDERLQLVDDILDSVAEDSFEEGLTEEQKAMLDARVAAYRANPERAVPWDEVRAWLRGAA